MSSSTETGCSTEGCVDGLETSARLPVRGTCTTFSDSHGVGVMTRFVIPKPSTVCLLNYLYYCTPSNRAWTLGMNTTHTIFRNALLKTLCTSTTPQLAQRRVTTAARLHQKRWKPSLSPAATRLRETERSASVGVFLWGAGFDL